MTGCLHMYCLIVCVVSRSICLHCSSSIALSGFRKTSFEVTPEMSIGMSSKSSNTLRYDEIARET